MEPEPRWRAPDHDRQQARFSVQRRQRFCDSPRRSAFAGTNAQYWCSDICGGQSVPDVSEIADLFSVTKEKNSPAVPE